MGGWVAPSLFAMPRAIEFQVRTASKTANDSFLRLFPPPLFSPHEPLFFPHTLTYASITSKEEGKEERERSAFTNFVVVSPAIAPLPFFQLFLMAMTRTHGVSKHFPPVSNAGEKHVGQPIVLSFQIDVLCGVTDKGIFED